MPTPFISSCYRLASGLLQGAAVLLAGGTVALAQPALTFTEYPVPLNVRPALAVGPDGALWFTEYGVDDTIGRISMSGAVTWFALPRDTALYPMGRLLEGMTAGPDGALWFTQYHASRIGRITVTGDITEFPLPGGHRQPSKITTGPDGALWFTESSDGVGRIGRITTAGVLTEYELPPCVPSCTHRPYGITTGPDGALWFTDPGVTTIWRITTSGVLTQFGRFVTQVGDITPGPDGALWFTAGDTAGPDDHIGRVTTSGAYTAFPLPIFPRPTYGGYNNLAPGSITTGPDGALWFAADRIGVLGRISTSGQVTLYRLPGGTVDDDTWVFRRVVLGPDGALWISTNKAIVRAALAGGGVTVDVKPGSCRNPINAKARGVLPVAILGTPAFDVEQVDISSIRLEGVPALRGSVEDVGGPPDVMREEECASTWPDGHADLALKFSIQAIVSALAPPLVDGAIRVLRLQGRLKPEFGGTPFSGEDVVVLKTR